MEEQKIENKKSKKIYLIAIISLLLIVGGGISYNYLINPQNDEGVFINNESFEKKVCTTIKATPSWVNEQGIIDVGYTNFNNANPKEIVDLLINAEIYLAYHSDCGACKSQIIYFNSEWERYVKSGYTIDCKDS